MSNLVGLRVVTRNQGLKGVIKYHSESSEVVCVEYDKPIVEHIEGDKVYINMRFYRLEEVKFV